MPLTTHASIRGPPTLAGSFGSVSYRVIAPLLWALVHTKFCLCPLRLESYFSQSSGSPIIKSCWPSGLDSLGIPSPFVRSSGWEAWCGSEPFQWCKNFFGIIVLQSVGRPPAGYAFDLIRIVPLLLSCCDFFVFECGVSFFGEFWCSPINGCSTASCNFGALTGGDGCISFYSVILNQNPIRFYKKKTSCSK